MRSSAVAKDAAAGGASTRAPRARVIGAGPAGVLAALHLARRGWQVDVCDKRPSQAEGSLTSRSYNVAISGWPCAPGRS